MRVVRIGLLTLVSGWAASAGWADVTESEARRVAQEHSTLSLDDARVDTLELGPSGCYAFTVRDPEGVEHMSLVDRDTGEYRGWRTAPRPTARSGDEPLTKGQAIEIVRAEAESRLGPLADRLEWGLGPMARQAAAPTDEDDTERRSLRPLSETGMAIWADLKPVGDPPRCCAGGVVSAFVAPDGSIAKYIQRVPTAEEMEPLPIEVTEERACEIAMGDVLAVEPMEGLEAISAYLTQSRRTVLWHVKLGDAEWWARGGPPDAPPLAPTLYINVDARSGEVVRRDRDAMSLADRVSTGAATWPRVADRRDVERALRRAGILCAVTVVLGGAALVVVRRRRR